MIIQILAAFLVTIFFSIIFNVHKNQLIICGSVGAAGWAMYLLSLNLTHSPVSSSLLAAFVVSTLSHMLAIKFKNPVTTYQISGIIPLVPGTGMYRTAFYLIEDELKIASEFMVETLMIAGAIALAMLIVNTFTELIKRMKEFTWKSGNN